MLSPFAKLHENSDLLSLEHEQNWTKLMLEKSPVITLHTHWQVALGMKSDPLET